MTNEQKQVRDWMVAFGQECPVKPCIPDKMILLLRAKLIVEETLEAVKALGCSFYWKRVDKQIGDISMSETQWHVKFEGEPDLEAIADGCEDLKVVTEGTLVACGLATDNSIGFNKAGGLAPIDNSDPLFDEVMRSNWSKFWCDSNDADNAEIKKHPEYKSTEVGHQNEADVSIYRVVDKDGKVIKSPSYSPANLQPIIDTLSK